MIARRGAAPEGVAVGSGSGLCVSCEGLEPRYSLSHGVLETVFPAFGSTQFRARTELHVDEVSWIGDDGQLYQRLHYAQRATVRARLEVPYGIRRGGGVRYLKVDPGLDVREGDAFVVESESTRDVTIELTGPMGLTPGEAGQPRFFTLELTGENDSLPDSGQYDEAELEAHLLADRGWIVDTIFLDYVGRRFPEFPRFEYDSDLLSIRRAVSDGIPDAYRIRVGFVSLDEGESVGAAVHRVDDVDGDGSLEIEEAVGVGGGSFVSEGYVDGVHQWFEFDTLLDDAETYFLDVWAGGMRERLPGDGVLVSVHYERMDPFEVSVVAPDTWRSGAELVTGDRISPKIRVVTPIDSADDPDDEGADAVVLYVDSNANGRLDEGERRYLPVAYQWVNEDEVMEAYEKGLAAPPTIDEWSFDVVVDDGWLGRRTVLLHARVRGVEGTVASGTALARVRHAQDQGGDAIVAQVADEFGRARAFLRHASGRYVEGVLNPERESAAQGAPVVLDDGDADRPVVGVPQGDGVVLYSFEGGVWRSRNLTVDLFAQGALPIFGDLVVILGSDGRRHLAGRTGDGGLVLYSQRQPGPSGDAEWSFADLGARDLAAQGQAVPAFAGRLTGYATGWGGLNVAGLDASGGIQVVWWAPGMTRWRVDNLSDITGAPPLSGDLTAYVTPWKGINLAGINSQGHVTVTWWVPSFGKNWVTSDLTSMMDGPGLIAGSLASYVTPWGGLNIAGINGQGEAMVYWWAPGMTGWRADSLSVAAGLDPSLQGRIEGRTLRSGVIQLFVAEASGQVVRLYWAPGEQWTWEGVTADALALQCPLAPWTRHAAHPRRRDM